MWFVEYTVWPDEDGYERTTTTSFMDEESALSMLRFLRAEYYETGYVASFAMWEE